MEDKEKICDIASQLENLQIIERYQDIKIRLSNIRERVLDEVFKVAVVGEYSSGKSTFINALIGRDLLSHARSETTATITYIHNVEKDDLKNGTCIINYQSGDKEQLDDMDRLSDYTTAQSGLEVAKDIKSVDIYINFIQSDYPVIIIDTPGLNGNAEHHRDITIKETAKAHACIYLFSLHGITKFDEQFIRLLSQYQRRFIMVQNFIDELKASEGESRETKVSQMDEIMREQIVAEGIDIEYSICGISALKALAGKDYSINRLYNSDTEDITEENRQRYYMESNFDELLLTLMNIVNSGEYKQIITASALQALEYITLKLKQILNIQSQENKMLMNKDEKNQVIQRVQKRLEYIENNKKKQKQKIKNFIISKDKGNRVLLKDKVRTMLEDAYKNISNILDKELSNYEQYEDLQKRTNYKIGQYFSNKVATVVNIDIASELENDIRTCLQVLYEDALQRSAQYSGIVLEGETGLFDISNAEIKENFEAEALELLEDINKQKERLDNEWKNVYKIEEQLHKNQNEISYIRKKIKQAKDVYFDEVARKNAQKEQLGQRPEYHEWIEEAIYERNRGGLFGKIGDFFLGKKKEVVSQTMSNIDEVAAWDREYNDKLKQEEKIRQKHENEVERLKDRIRDLETQIDKEIISRESAYIKIDRYEFEIEKKKEDYKMSLSNARKEFCETQRNSMKKVFQNKLFEAEDNMNDRFRDYIDKYSSENIEIMIDKVLDSYKKQTEYNIDRLKVVLNNNTEQLEKEYNVQKHELAIIEKVEKCINDIKNEGRYTHEPV